MAYQKKTWANDEIIQANALNNIEKGISDIDTKLTQVEQKNNQQDLENAQLQQKDEQHDKDITALKGNTANATTSKAGIVKQATAVELVTTADATNITGTTADADINKIVALVNKNKKQLNALINALKTAGIIA